MLKLSEIMTQNVITVTPQTTLREAVELFAATHISGAPVLSGNTIAGVVSTADILGFAAASPDEMTWHRMIDSAVEDDVDCETVASGSYFTDLWPESGTDAASRMSTVSVPEWALLDDHTVDEVMTRDPVSLGPQDTVLAAAELMQLRSIHRVLVVKRGRLVGIVSALDVACAVAEHRLNERAHVIGE